MKTHTSGQITLFRRNRNNFNERKTCDFMDVPEISPRVSQSHILKYIKNKNSRQEYMHI